jgi:hypothetical protein
MLTLPLAEKFAGLAIEHVRREFPNKLDHVINDAGDLRSPRELHPIFFGSFDWHSCVHGYWLLARMLRRYPSISAAPRIRELFDSQLTPGNVAAEVAYLHQPNRGTFERSYGWAWILMLAAELTRAEGNDGRWAAEFQPLASQFVARFLDFIPKATYPIRAGAHYNTAFAFALALEYADVCGDARFGDVIRNKAISWYGKDADCQAWEPGGGDFISPALMEAECMRRVLPREEFTQWFQRFLPRIGDGDPATLVEPAFVSDRSDGKIGHLDGLNFSRAWCWRSLASGLAASDPRHGLMRKAADAHIAASLSHVAGDYMGEHWLATFATLALDEGGD